MFLIIWQFETDEAHVEQFKSAYNTDGAWAQLFRRSAGYIRTDLACDVNAPLTYFTFDYWRTAQDFQNFQDTHAEEYRRLDRSCDSLTKRESKVGEFTLSGNT
jgi:heme-degrading monooxygenase HmoA